MTRRRGRIFRILVAVGVTLFIWRRNSERREAAELAASDGQWRVRGDPTEGALVVAARKAGLTPERLRQRFARYAELPFSAGRRRISRGWASS